MAVPGYGQTAELHALMAHGASMGISRDVSSLLDELAVVKPTLLYAVPQLFKKVCDAIHAKVRELEVPSPRGAICCLCLVLPCLVFL